MKYPVYLLLSLLLFFSCETKGKEQKREVTGNTPSALTEQNACLFSQIAYCADIQSALKQYMPGWNTVWEAKELGGNHAFVATNGNEYVLAIRGSLINFSWAAFQNWIYQDFNITSQLKWPHTDDSSNAKISQGAWGGWQNLCQLGDKKTGQLLLPFLKTIIKEDTHLLVTGHSLGGNLATVYASYLWQMIKIEKHFIPSVNVITFAAPAAGNEAFAEDFNKKFPSSLRVENSNDIVPKFPSASGISALASLFSDSLSANKIMVGYNDLSMSLDKVFGLMHTAIVLLELTNQVSAYDQTNGKGKIINAPLSGKNNGNDILNWLNEAGYQHSIKQYAAFEKVAIVACAE